MLVSGLNVLAELSLTPSAVAKWKQIFRCRFVDFKILGRQTDGQVRVGWQLHYKSEISWRNCTKAVPQYSRYASRKCAMRQSYKK